MSTREQIDNNQPTYHNIFWYTLKLQNGIKSNRKLVPLLHMRYILCNYKCPHKEPQHLPFAQKSSDGLFIFFHRQ